MSLVSHLLLYLIIYPFICITLAELLNFLTESISTTMRRILGRFQGNTGDEITGDAPETRESADQVNTWEMVTYLFDVMMRVWSIITVKLYNFTGQLITLLRADNIISDGDDQLLRPSVDGRNENQETERRPPASAPEIYLRRLRSGRVYGITPVLNNPSVETRHAASDDSQNGRSPSASGNSRSRRRRSPENWFGDSYRLRQEERVPDHVQRYGRSSSLLTNSSSPVSLANMLGTLRIIESMSTRSRD